MPRKPRGVTAPFSHVFARGNDHQPIFLTDEDRAVYLMSLASVILRYQWRMLAWCLMTNHVHLVVETREANLSDGMRRLHGGYAVGFNQRHGRKNHLFGERFRDVPILDEGHLLMEIRYVLQNPVKAGLAAAPDEYPYASHRHVRHDSAPHLLDVPRLLEMFEAWGGDPLDRYLRLVEDDGPPGQASVAS